MTPARWAAELAELAQAGARVPATPYDAARYARFADIAAALSISAADAADGSTQPADAGTPGPTRGEMAALVTRTPRVAADAAVFDAAGRVLLIQRADNGLWALPGGAADVGELPAAAAERETWEETGLRVRAERLLGAYASPARGGPGYPLVVLVFLCRYVAGTPVVTHETRDMGYFPPSELPPLARGHARRVGDAVAALAALETGPAIFD